MIKHIVMWRLKKEAISNQQQLTMQQSLLNLKNIIPEIHSIEVALPSEKLKNNCDIILYSEFKNTNDLETYQNHEKHQEVVQFVKKIADDRFVFDYEV